MAPSRTRTSKDLLQLEHSDTSLAPGVKLFSICKAKKVPCTTGLSKTLPLDAVVGGSDVLHRVQAFLPVLSEANRELAEAIKEKGQDAYDIEILKGHKTASYVEMDLALGVADLCSEKAVSAAEKLVGGQIINTARIEADSDHGMNTSNSDDETVSKETIVRMARRPKIVLLS